jgi:hypothetical protein
MYPQATVPVLPPDEKTLLENQLADQKRRLKEREQQHQEKVEEQRKKFRADLKAVQEEQELRLSMQTKEKQKLVDDMNATVELEKEKI